MMTFKQHIELSESLSQFSDVSIYLDSLDLVERLKTLRSINESYPLEDRDEITDHIKDNFNCSEKVFDLVLGQFIMVEQILTGKFKFKGSVYQDLELMIYLLRPKGEEHFDNGDILKEQQHRQNILNTPVQDLYSAINRFLKDRDIVLFQKFSGVFYSTVDESEEEGLESMPTPDELFNQQWYWYSIVRNLAQEDIRRYNSIYMLKMNVVLPEMSYLAQKNKIDAANQRQQAAMNRL